MYVATIVLGELRYVCIYAYICGFDAFLIHLKYYTPVYRCVQINAIALFTKLSFFNILNSAKALTDIRNILLLNKHLRITIPYVLYYLIKYETSSNQIFSFSSSMYATIFVHFLNVSSISSLFPP